MFCVRPAVLSLVATMLVSLLSPSVARADEDLDRAIATIAERLGERAEARGTRTIAVVDFAALDGSVPDLGRHLAESLITELFSAAPGGLEAIERRHLRLVLERNNLRPEQLFEPQLLSHIGESLGVGEIVTGALTDLGDRVEINVRRIAVDSGRITDAFRLRVANRGAVRTLLARGRVDPDARGPAPAAPQQTRAARIEQAGVIVEVVRVRRQGAAAIVELALTAERRDVDLSLWGRMNEGSRIVTDDGIGYEAERALVGGDRGSGYAAGSLVAGVPTPAALLFEDVGPEARAVARITLRGKHKTPGTNDWSEPWTAVLRNIPFE